MMVQEGNTPMALLLLLVLLVCSFLVEESCAFSVPRFNDVPTRAHRISLSARQEAEGEVRSSLADDVDTTKTDQKKRRKPYVRIPVVRYEDDWVCVNKPAGMATHRTRNTRPTDIVLDTSLKRQLSRRVFPVHRLDHRTSGAVLYGFDSETCDELQNTIKDGKKQYLAICRGEWEFLEKTVVMDKPLRIKNDIQDAQTRFTVLATMSPSALLDNSTLNTAFYEDNDGEIQSYRKDRCCLLLCEPITEQAHQIRRHAFLLGHPILGDSQYGDSKVNRWWRENSDLNRLGLHCFSMQFELNESAEEVLAPLPLELQNVLRTSVPDLYDTVLQYDPRLGMEPTDVVSGSYGRDYRQRKEETRESNN